MKIAVSKPIWPATKSSARVFARNHGTPSPVDGEEPADALEVLKAITQTYRPNGGSSNARLREMCTSNHAVPLIDCCRDLPRRV